MERKKGIQLNEAFTSVLALVLIATLVIVAILVFVNLGSSFTNEAGSVTGESLTPPGTVSNATNCNFNSFTLVTATNSSGSLISSGNYTTTSDGTVTNTTGLFNATATPWILNYTFLQGGAACEASEGLIVQFGTYPALVGLVGTIIFLGLVIGVLVASFLFTGRRGA